LLPANRPPGLPVNYFIAFSGRTGSSMLCQMLTRTGVLGQPEEHFNFKAGKLWGNGAVERWAELLPERVPPGQESDRPNLYRLHYARYQHLTRSPYGVTGAKVTWDHYYRLCAGLGERPWVDRWIWLRRRDKLRQAISSYKNHATLQAQLRPGVERRPDPPFDPEEILNWALRYQAEDAIWESEFLRYRSTTGVDGPLHICYEDLVADPGDFVRGIADYLHVALDPLQVVPSDHLRMANETSEAWYQQLLPAWRLIS
jgi:LPS sulfotransferase NodH